MLTGPFNGLDVSMPCMSLGVLLEKDAPWIVQKKYSNGEITKI
jgi:hypothetical protein